MISFTFNLYIIRTDIRTTSISGVVGLHSITTLHCFLGTMTSLMGANKLSEPKSFINHEKQTQALKKLLNVSIKPISPAT